jgi:hypothetical protein
LLLTSQELLGDKPERYFLGKLWLGSMPSQSFLSAGGISHRILSWRRKGTKKNRNTVILMLFLLFGY